MDSYQQTRGSEGQQREELHQALITVRHSVTRLFELLNIRTDFDLEMFNRTLDTKLLTRLSPDYPLVVGITGGGSTGKSSLFNALAKKKLSAVKARAGLSRRVLAAVHPNLLSNSSFLESLDEVFGTQLKALNSLEELTTPGPARYIKCETLPCNLVLLDTPDFDTGDRLDFSNRGVAKPVLEACDILIYIFTNATYNNRGNTAFLRDMLTGVGNRGALLVYRCSRALSEEEIKEHAGVVTRHIYGDDSTDWLIGIYRVDEDDRVAEGKDLMVVRSLDGGPAIQEKLDSLDCSETRLKVIRSAFKDVQKDARATLDAAAIARKEIELYRDVARISTSWATTKALKSFPQADLLNHFLRIWENEQPAMLKVLRKTGRVMGAPITGVLWTARKVRDCIRREAQPESKPYKEEIFQKELCEAANGLHNRLKGKSLSSKTTYRDPEGKRLAQLVEEVNRLYPDSKTHVEELGGEQINIDAPRPDSLVDDAGGQGWQARIEILCQKASMLEGVSSGYDEQLRRIARKFRKDMKLRQKVREVFTASLPSIGAVAAVAYVLGTGDVTTGGSIYANVTAMFGLNDLYALVAIPTATGLSKLDRENLQAILSPVLKEWLGEKTKEVRKLLEHHVAGGLIELADDLIKRTDKPFRELEQASSRITTATESLSEEG